MNDNDSSMLTTLKAIAEAAKQAGLSAKGTAVHDLANIETLAREAIARQST